MKILHIGKYHPPFMGGIENFMADLMRQQVFDGHDVSALVHHHESDLSFVEEVLDGVNILRVPCYGQIVYAPIAPSFGFHLNKIIKKAPPDILHIHMPNLSAFWCLLLPIARKIPWVIHWHADVIGSVPDLKIKLLYPFYRVFESALLKRSQKIIATSSVYLASSLPLKKWIKKTVVIPLGLRLIEEKINADVLKHNLQEPLSLIDSEQIKLLMIGRLTYYKGHNVIIDAIAKLKDQGVDFSLRIVGGGELLADIEQQIKDLRLENSVILLGKLSSDDLENELQNTDLLCLPSIERTEAFGVVLLEAKRAGKPCLISDVCGSGMSWVVQDDETGFVVKHNDVDSLVGKLKFIIANRGLLKAYGATGRKRFEKIFSIGAVSSEISALYEQISKASN